MTPSTTKHTSPVPAGTCTAAPARRQIPPFAAVPHDVAADPRLTPTDLRVIAALLYYACSKPMCYPSDAGIAERVHKHPGTVRRCLKRIEDLGYIRREFVTATPDNPTGRLIHLTFTEPGWARPTTQRDAPERRRAPAPERRRTSTPCAAAQSPRAQAPVPPRAPAHAEEDVIVEKEENLGETDASAPPLRSRPVDTLPSPAHEPAQVVPSAGGTLPFDLRAVGAVPEFQPRPAAPSMPAQRRRIGLGLTLEELAKVAGETADPILAAELARRTAPPAPPEPPPMAVPTAELLAKLPGRHDLIMVTARRLIEETEDFQVASLRTFEKMAEAVATRSVPSAVLIDCWRQGLGPRAGHKGKVLVAAWKREAPLRR